MDINILVQRLQRGETYKALDSEGNEYTTTRPPTALSIKAAEVITQQNNLITTTQQTSLNLQRQIQDLNERYELLRQSIPTPETSPQN
jgi:hypothetical protein